MSKWFHQIAMSSKSRGGSPTMSFAWFASIASASKRFVSVRCIRGFASVARGIAKFSVH